MNQNDPNPEDMAEEVRFSSAVRGKHVQSYRAGHRVRVLHEDGTVQEQHFTLEDGAVMIDPDLRAKFPDSESVNRALRSIAESA